MKLDWVYDPNTRVSKVTINSELYYTTNDGGQTIHKYINNELVDTFHKYGPDYKFANVNFTGSHLKSDEYLDPWPEEVKWLTDTYPNIVGKWYRDWDKGYLNKKGELEGVGTIRGMGIVSPELPISVNRICQPASVQEMWDYEQIAFTEESPYEDCHGGGLKWMKHKVTGQIVRMGAMLVPYPCCAFPSVHGPWPVDESDIEKHNGKPIK